MARLGRGQPALPIIRKSQVNQYLRPDADDDVASWTTAPLFSKIDEGTADTADEISSEVLVAAGDTTIAKISLGTGVDPVTGVNHVLRIWAKVTFTLGINGGIRVELRQSGTLIATLTTDALTTSYKPYEYALTTGEADAITDYSALAIWVYGNFPVGSLGGVQVAWFEFDIPPAVAVAATNAQAGVATGTGVANGVTTALQTGTGVAGATGAAGGPQSSVGVSAGLASGSGAAGNPTGTRTGEPQAGVASGTGVATGPTVSLQPGTGVAGGTGAAGGPGSSVAPIVGVATGIGAAFDATVLTGTVANAGVASGTGTANGITASLQPGTGVAGATGAAGGPQSTVSPVAGSASGIGAANAATVTTGTVANAGVATGTGIANSSTVTLQPGTGVAGATGSAGGPGSSVAPIAGVATGTGTANNATVTAVASIPGGKGRVHVAVRPRSWSNITVRPRSRSVVDAEPRGTVHTNGG